VNIGSFCRIADSLEFGGQKCKSDNQERIRIGNNVDAGNNAFMNANNNIEVGDNVILSSYVFSYDHDHTFDNMEKIMHEQSLTEDGYVNIGDNVFLGVKSMVLRNVTIGKINRSG